MDIIVFRRRLVMPPPTGAFIFTTRVFTTSLLLLPPTRVHFITAMQLCHHGGATSSLLSSALAIFRISTWTSSTHIFNQAITIRRQDAIILDSMFSCFPTNQRVGGYTNIRLKIWQILYKPMSQLQESLSSSLLRNRHSTSTTSNISV